ncbi:MAG: hypothetical protein ACI4J3_04265 [Oscillospiraceae bacterium]
MKQPWFESDMKIYTPRVRTSYEGAGDGAGETMPSGEQETLSLWNPSGRNLQMPPQRAQEDQPYTEP